MSDRDDELGKDSNYSDIAQSPSYTYLKKRFKVRRLICRVCKLKFRTREETQAHIKREHRRIQTEYNETRNKKNGNRLKNKQFMSE